MYRGWFLLVQPWDCILSSAESGASYFHGHLATGGSKFSVKFAFLFAKPWAVISVPSRAPRAFSTFILWMSDTIRVIYYHRTWWCQQTSENPPRCLLCPLWLFFSVLTITHVISRNSSERNHVCVAQKWYTLLLHYCTIPGKLYSCKNTTLSVVVVKQGS